MKARTDQARTVIIGEARSPVGVSLGLRLIGDEEVATITLTQHDQAVILHCADQAHAARIAAAIEALPAAPAVQGEPVGEVRFELGAPSSIFAELYSKSLPVLAPGTKLYAAPQPAEQQPCPEDIREGAPYDDSAFESLCREHEIWGTAAAALCALFWEAGKRAAEQQPAPDVSALVEALEVARIDLKVWLESFPNASREPTGKIIERIDAALAAHRKQGGEV